MKTKDRQIGWHLFLVVVVFLLLMPIVFAISNSFKTMQEAFNTVFQVIPLHPTLENYRHVFDKLPFVKITLNTFLIAQSLAERAQRLRGAVFLPSGGVCVRLFPV